MQSISGSLFDLNLSEIDYRLSALTDSQRAIILHLAEGATDGEIAQMQRCHKTTIQQRLYSACDRAGVCNRAQLIALFSVWRYLTGTLLSSGSSSSNPVHHPSGLRT